MINREQLQRARNDVFKAVELLRNVESVLDATLKESKEPEINPVLALKQAITGGPFGSAREVDELSFATAATKFPGIVAGPVRSDWLKDGFHANIPELKQYKLEVHFNQLIAKYTYYLVLIEH